MPPYLDIHAVVNGEAEPGRVHPAGEATALPGAPVDGSALRVRLLGPLEVAVGSAGRAVSGLRRKAILAVLALHPREVVSSERIIDIVWADQAPATAANALQSHLSYLRRVLGHRAAIVARSGGYLLDVAAEAIDVAEAERLIGQRLAGAGQPEAAVSLRAALTLWRGDSLAGLTEIPWLFEQARRLDNLRRQAVLELNEARLALGEHAQLISDLQHLAAQHPLREDVHRQLIVALYRSGRQAEALATYHRLRRGLNEELGIDPSTSLRDLESAILRQDPALDPPLAITTSRPATVVAAPPAQLPMAVSTFTGRDAELARLYEVLDTANDATASGQVVAVSGMAGVGKTALAVHWAHRVSGQFPDGRLFVDLRGFSPTSSVLDPAETLRAFLLAFGVPLERLPPDVGTLTSVYRSVLAGKRVLIVLDNARDAGQIRPLLPGSSGCLVLVTSRDQLTSLVAAEGAHLVQLHLPSAANARAMLARRLGAQRVAAEPDAVDDIIARCARLPLALAIAAARAATTPGLSLAGLAAQLDASEAALDALNGGDTTTDIRVSFSSSYRALSPEAARLFRRLGSHPGITVDVAANLMKLPAPAARGLLAELTRIHMVTETPTGEFHLHDLLRAFAAEQAHLHDGVDMPFDAPRRLFGPRHPAHSAPGLPTRSRVSLDSGRVGVTVANGRDKDARRPTHPAHIA